MSGGKKLLSLSTLGPLLFTKASPDNCLPVFSSYPSASQIIELYTKNLSLDHKLGAPTAALPFLQLYFLEANWVDGTIKERERRLKEIYTHSIEDLLNNLF